MPTRPAYDDAGEGGRHRSLGEDRAERRSADAEVEAVDEDHVEYDVADGTRDGDDQRGARVLKAAQHARAGEDEEHRAGCRAG